MATLTVTGRADLGDAQWAVLEPLLPPARGAARRRGRNGSSLTGSGGGSGRCAWRDVPAEYGPWQTVYGLFRRWQRDGTWAQVLAGLQARADAAGLITWDVSVDSTVARAH